MRDLSVATDLVGEIVTVRERRYDGGKSIMLDLVTGRVRAVNADHNGVLVLWVELIGVINVPRRLEHCLQGDPGDVLCIACAGEYGAHVIRVHHGEKVGTVVRPGGGG